METRNPVVFVDPWDVEWDQSLQADERSESFGDPIEQFAPNFAVMGWDVSQGTIKVHEIRNKNEADRLIAERQARVADWENRGDEQIILHRLTNQSGEEGIVAATYAELAEFAKDKWTTARGDWRKPKHRGIACYRRGYALMACLLAYITVNEKKEEFKVPITVKEYKSDDQEFLERLKENGRQGLAFYGNADLLHISSKLVKMGMTETQVAAELPGHVKRGQAQKYHSWACIAAKYPNLNLSSRARMKVPTDENDKVIKPTPYEPGGYFPFTTATAKQARTLLGNAKTVDSMDETVVAATKIVEPGKAASEKQVEAFIKLLCAGKKNEAKMMEKAQIKTLRDQASRAEVRDVFDGILTNDGAMVAAAMESITAALNEVDPQEVAA